MDVSIISGRMGVLNNSSNQHQTMNTTNSHVSLNANNKRNSDTKETTNCSTDKQQSEHVRQQQSLKKQRTVPSIGPKLGQELICAYCWEIIVQATTIVPCGHTFCRECIYHPDNHDPRCPTCRDAIVDTVPNRTINNIIQTLSSEYTNGKDVDIYEGKRDDDTTCSSEPILRCFTVADIQTYRKRVAFAAKTDGMSFKEYKRRSESSMQERQQRRRIVTLRLPVDQQQREVQSPSSRAGGDRSRTVNNTNSTSTSSATTAMSSSTSASPTLSQLFRFNQMRAVEQFLPSLINSIPEYNSSTASSFDTRLSDIDFPPNGVRRLVNSNNNNSVSTPGTSNNNGSNDVLQNYLSDFELQRFLSSGPISAVQGPSIGTTTTTTSSLDNHTPSTANSRLDDIRILQQLAHQQQIHIQQQTHQQQVWMDALLNENNNNNMMMMNNNNNRSPMLSNGSNVNFRSPTTQLLESYGVILPSPSVDSSSETRNATTDPRNISSNNNTTAPLNANDYSRQSLRVQSNQDLSLQQHLLQGTNPRMSPPTSTADYMRSAGWMPRM